MCLPPLSSRTKKTSSNPNTTTTTAAIPPNTAAQSLEEAIQKALPQFPLEGKVPQMEESLSPLLSSMEVDAWFAPSDTLSSPDAFATVPSTALRSSAFEDVLVGVPSTMESPFEFPEAGVDLDLDMDSAEGEEDSFGLAEPVSFNRALKREASLMDSDSNSNSNMLDEDDVAAAYEDMKFDDPTFTFGDSDEKPCKKQRKRKPTRELPPAELAKTREINRIAAQRHRVIAKQKKVERERRLELVSTRNEELRNEAQKINAELATLKKLIISMYGPGGPRQSMVSSAPTPSAVAAQLSPLPTLAW